jgi:DNA-binding NarL/FixJ family response regulator
VRPESADGRERIARVHRRDMALHERMHRPVGVADDLAAVCRLGPHEDSPHLLAFVNRRADSTAFATGASEHLTKVISAILPRVGDSLSRCASAEPTPSAGELVSKLSKAERRLLPFLLSAHTEADIARLLHRSKHTIHTHANSIYRQLNVQSRMQLLLLFVDKASELPWL